MVGLFFGGLTLVPRDPLMVQCYLISPFWWISRNPFPMSVGEGFRLLDDYELLLFYRIFGLMSIVIGQVRLGFYGCRVG